MSDVMVIAVRAEESAKAAHHRLNQINGSVKTLADEVKKANDLCQQILQRLERQDGYEAGAETAKTGFLDSRRWVIGIAATFLCSALFTTIFTLIARRHG